MTDDDAALVTTRRLWAAAETVHAVTYFADESLEAARTVGLQGFWRGYFAMRSAPFGAVGPAVTTATFFNFQPAMVAKALPGVWQLTTPADAVAARVAGATAALARVLGDVDPTPATERLRAAIEAATPVGRALFAANTSLPWPGTPLGDLWHATTLVREHRGDGHNAALVAHGIDGCQAHVLTAATGGPPRTETQPYRGWSDDEWEAATDGLRSRGLVDADGVATAAGDALKASVERSTDEAAGAPWRRLGDAGTTAVLGELEGLARTVAAAGVLRYPNPIGLPPVT